MATQTADASFRLAKAWLGRGNADAAEAGFRRALQIDPDHGPAHLELGGVLLRKGAAREALQHYERAAALDTGNETARFRLSYVRRLLEDPTHVARVDDSPHATLAPPPSNPRGKIDLRHQVGFRAHRSGWGYGLEALMSLHNRRGILFDGFVERNFAWRHWAEGRRSPEVLQRMMREGTFEQLATSEERGITPYREPWVGVLHNPQGMPTWFHYRESPQAIFEKAIWKESLRSCVGLFALSAYHAAWLRERTGKPVSVLTLPTEMPSLRFDLARFLVNRSPKIVQIGWWLRRMHAIGQLPIARGNPMGYEKIRLVPRFFGDADRYLAGLMEREAAVYGLEVDPAHEENTRTIQHLSDDAYDALLSENIAFLELYDASANNAVVECIARATPLLVNPLPAVVEYLGEGYPLYFSSLAEAAEKASDRSLIAAAHRYLAGCERRERLSGDHFRDSVERSEVYRLI